MGRKAYWRLDRAGGEQGSPQVNADTNREIRAMKALFEKF